MAYATEAKVISLMSQFALVDTSLDSTQLTTIIEDVAGVLDTALAAQGVTVPVTIPAYFLDMLEGCNSDGAVAKALRSIFPDAGGPGEQPASSYWQARFDKCLAGIKDGSLIPPDAPKGERIAPSTYLTRNSETEEDLGSIAEPQFKVGDIF